MRCPSCGTENAPDSRFCGGCGARLEPSRVAPTVKLHDDAPANVPTPPPGSMNIGHLPTPAPGSLSYRPASMPPTNNPASIPPTNNPASIPPTNNPASIPPTNHRLASQPGYAPPTSQSPGSQPPGSQPPGQRRASTPAPSAMSSPSLSMMPPRRSGAMIAIVLVIDLALAAAGATLLVKGLAKPKAADAKPAKTEAQKPTTAAPAPTALAQAPAPAAAPEPIGSAAPEPPAPPAPPIDKTVARDPKKHGGKPDTKKVTANGPLDPYGAGGAAAPAVDLTAEIDAHAKGSFGAFRACFSDAIHAGPVHGDIRIAFVVEPDGRVDHAAPVVNTTGSDALGSCLAQTIGGWTFAPHSGAAATYERPFNYP
ncbi:MAG: zinc-ribbon domain-containing protein [Deltaproteobacteria bacterium]|nr:zinc-ribbon domain-containing protein [Deltaproteobacteria bacterium]